MHTIYLVLYLTAAVCFLLAAANVASGVNLIALGLLAWVLAPLIATIRTN